MIIEPHGDMRTMAATLIQATVAFEQAGFTHDEAIRLTRDILIQGMSASPRDDE